MMAEKLLDIIKWWLIIAIGVAAFYIVYPKYEYADNGRVRQNKITGEAVVRLDKYGNTEILWEADKPFSLMSKR